MHSLLVRSVGARLRKSVTPSLSDAFVLLGLSTIPPPTSPLRHPVVQLQPPFRSLADTPLSSFVSSPRTRLSRLLRFGRGPPVTLSPYRACLTTRAFFGTRVLFFALLPSGFCSLRQWFLVASCLFLVGSFLLYTFGHVAAARSEERR